MMTLLRDAMNLKKVHVLMSNRYEPEFRPHLVARKQSLFSISHCLWTSMCSREYRMFTSTDRAVMRHTDNIFDFYTGRCSPFLRDGMKKSGAQIISV